MKKDEVEPVLNHSNVFTGMERKQRNWLTLNFLKAKIHDKTL